MTKQDVLEKLPHRAVIILQGISGSGKSTFVEDLANFVGNPVTEDVQVVSNDHFWVNEKTGAYEYNPHFHDDAEFFCKENFDYFAKLPIDKRPLYLVVDNTHTKLKNMRHFTEGGQKNGWDVIIVTLQVSPETGIKRNIHGTPGRDIRGQYQNIKKFQTPKGVIHYIINEGLE
jgi:hypothetical protein